MLHHITGDLFTIETDYIAHGVNTDGVMGAGVAKVIAERYPACKVQYQTDCRVFRLMPGGYSVWYGQGVAIFNLASQDAPGPFARLEWLESSLSKALDLLMDGTRVAMPWIGAGIGGLTRPEVADVISSVAASYPAIELTVVTASFDEPASEDVLDALLSRL